MRRGVWTGLAIGSVAGGLAAAVAVTAVGASSSPACAGTAPATTGQASFYRLANGGGNCSYAGPPADDLYVALGPAEYRKAGACGGYLQISGPRGKVRAKVVDQCPECKPGHLDMSATAFARIADPKQGIVPVSFTRVVNPPVPPLSFAVRPGSSQYWLAVLVIDNGNPLTRVRATAPGRGWVDLRHTEHNTWEATQGVGPGPYSFEVTDDQGHRVVARGLRLAIGEIQATSVTMYGGRAAAAKPVKPSNSAKPSGTALAAPKKKAPSAKKKQPGVSPAPAPVPTEEPVVRSRAQAAASPC
jgi:expansin (peptidoglycan-binding protein)